jgi:hypothetical protein
MPRSPAHGPCTNTRTSSIPKPFSDRGMGCGEAPNVAEGTSPNEAGDPVSTRKRPSGRCTNRNPSSNSSGRLRIA